MKKTTNAEDKALDLFAEMMIEKIQSIQTNWHQPWFSGGITMPKNLAGRYYNGMNSLMLMMHTEKCGYKTSRYATFDSIKKLNEGNDSDDEKNTFVHVLKGEHSFPVFLTMFIVSQKSTGKRISYTEYNALPAEEQNDYNVFPRQRLYYVFNLDQTNLKEKRPELWDKILKEDMIEKPINDTSFCIPQVDTMIENGSWICPIRMQENRAYYSTTLDFINVPSKENFESGESFYSTLFHEMGHSTGKESCLNRSIMNSFDSSDYAKEELIAELTAALTCQQFAIEKHVNDESAAYIKSWLACLKKSPEFIKDVLKDVRRAHTTIMCELNKQNVAAV